MTYDGLLLSVVTRLHRYLVRRDQILELRTVVSEDDLQRPDERGKAIISSELASLLDPEDSPQYARRHAIIVPTRRRSIALLVDRIEDVYSTSAESIHRLPSLFLKQLQRPWFLGVVVQDQTPCLVLDLRQIAQDVMLSSKEKKKA